LPSERIGASGFLFFLSLIASSLSALCYAKNSRTLGHRTRWFAGLVGGVAAAATFSAPVAAGYAGLANVIDSWPLLALAIVLPILTGWYWPALSARLWARHGSN
jgi:hypothetical protein